MMRNSLSFQRTRRPTLLTPPNSFSFILREMTITGSGPVSAASVQVPPYWNGTSNIAKKSFVVTRVAARSGFACWPSDGQDADRLVHDHLVLRDVGAVHRHRVAIGQLFRRQLGLLVVVRLLRIPEVHGHGVEHVVLPPDRVAGHRAVHRQRHDADRDAERDRADHQQRSGRDCGAGCGMRDGGSSRALLGSPVRRATSWREPAARHSGPARRRAARTA